MKELRTRDQVPAEAKWNLLDIYPTETQWEQEFEEVTAALSEMEALKETLVSSPQALAAGLRRIDEVSLLLERLYVYARMRRDEDNARPQYQALTDRAMGLSVRLSSALSWLNPLLLEQDETLLRGWLKDCPELSDYDFFLNDLLRSKQHVLPAREEKLLSLAGDFSGGARDIFTMLNNADLTFKPVCVNGEEQALSHATYSTLMQNKDRAVRKDTYDRYYQSYKDQINTIAATYATSVKKDVFYARARGYESALAKALFADDVPTSVYENLIASIHDNLDILYRYVALRKKLLGVEELEMYDIYVPLVEDAPNRFTFEEAKQLVLEALAPLGEDYLKVLKGAFANGWADVYENKGKTSGAYSWGVWGVHPYVLLNHKDDLNSVYTLAHEMGHAMHSYYSDKTQPYSKAGYTIFVAEVASTVNEILLTRHLLKTTTDKKLRAFVLNYYIDQFRTTVLRQTMFAEFEKITHEMAEKGEPLTQESFCQAYGKLNELYHGPDMKKDDTICYEWARIPHFYNAFYVYKYATGFSCACAIVKNLEKPGMVEKYRNFLKSGGSDYPLKLLEGAGVTFDTVVSECMAEFASALEQFEAIS